MAKNAGSRNSQAGALGTIACETASTFRPLHEYGTRADWARYSGGADYAGRGFIQLTHDYNYRAVGQEIGVDLVRNPDLAMDPHVAAQAFAIYWAARDIQGMADRNDWLTLRKAVVGYVANPPGYERVRSVALALLG